jgi:hypothetical protein
LGTSDRFEIQPDAESDDAVMKDASDQDMVAAEMDDFSASDVELDLPPLDQTPWEDDGPMMEDDGEVEFQNFTSSNIAGLEGAQENTRVGFTEMSGGNDVYSYFDDHMIRNWAGPMHWKLTRSQKTSYII